MATDGRYIFRSCVPDGAIDIANVKPGDTLSRAYTFAVNDFDQSSIQSMLNSGELDPRLVARGVDGELFDESGNLLATVPEWRAQLTPKTTEYLPAGKLQSWKIVQSYSVSLTLVETVVKDAALLSKTLTATMSRSGGVLNFQGVIRSRTTAA